MAAAKRKSIAKLCLALGLFVLAGFFRQADRVGVCNGRRGRGSGGSVGGHGGIVREAGVQRARQVASAGICYVYCSAMPLLNLGHIGFSPATPQHGVAQWGPHSTHIVINTLRLLRP